VALPRHPLLRHLVLHLRPPHRRGRRHPIDPICLSEALPFFVITVGFDKPLRFASAVFLHPHVLSASEVMSSSEVVESAWARVRRSIWRDYAIEVGVLSVGVLGGVGIVREFCAQAVVILLIDAGSLVVFYSAVLGIMVEVGVVYS
jgi:hydroxymethylglutaryl-CoA reductase (NADPH)